MLIILELERKYEHFGGDLVLLIEAHVTQFWLSSNSSLSISFSNSDTIYLFFQSSNRKELCPV